jgi:AcrR family transcriptional regulator
MPKIVDKQAKAKAISKAAIQVFREQGYHEARMADIAEAAGIGKGTLYEYFKGKPDILRFIFQDYFAEFSRGLVEALKSAHGPAEKLLALVDFAVVHSEEWEDQCAVYINCFSSPKTREDLFSLSDIYGPMKNIIASLVREGQAAGEIQPTFVPEVVAQLFVSIYDGIILHRMLQGRAMESEALLQALFGLLKTGLFEHAAAGS